MRRQAQLMPAWIGESHNITDILKYCSFNTWVILDLDNTVMESIQALGSDQWFCSMMQFACSIELDKSEAIEAVIEIYHTVQHHVTMRAVEAKTAEIIKALQDIGVSVLALTARSKTIAEPTLKQLKAIGIDFSKQWKDDAEPLIVFEKENTSVHFMSGIIFCSGHEKAQCFKAFSERHCYYPQHVLMVDDKEKYLHTMCEYVNRYGGRFTGLRYAYLDEKVENHDAMQAADELSQIMHKFPDGTQHKITRLKVSSFSRSLFFNPLPAALTDEAKLELEEEVKHSPSHS